jgi:hypothetical protein
MPLYVAAVEGRMVPRYGTARQVPGQMEQRVLKRTKTSRGRTVRIRVPGKVYGHEYFGVTRTKDASTGAVKLAWDTSVVYMISDAEITQFRREYAMHVTSGDLIAKTAKDHAAYHEKLEAAAKARAAEDAKAANDAKAVAAAAEAKAEQAAQAATTATTDASAT